MQARHLCWFVSVKYSIVRCLSNAVVKVPRNCWERTLNFRNNPSFSFWSNYSLILLFLNKNKNENTEYYGTFISFKSHLYSKQGSPILLLFGWWTFNVCMKMVIEFHVFLTELNGWAFVYKVSGCGINSCCSYLSFRCDTHVTW